ncbi:unnamed protein product [Brassica rapa]|uniref:Uncharacterized protein n=1 Tax=Brassica campestris TaxID=3711 RepID=A0A8D9MHP4_BRACM|nr:unnamed protein product [Brassica rapa]
MQFLYSGYLIACNCHQEGSTSQDASHTSYRSFFDKYIGNFSSFTLVFFSHDR